MDILNLIWCEYVSSTSPSPQSRAEQKALQAQLNEEFEQFKKSITKEQFKAILRMEVNYTLLLSLDDETRFKDAFRLGANFMAKLLSND